MDGHHKIMFDAENLAYHCAAAGFGDCEKRCFDPSLDMASWNYGNLYMVCRKEEGP